MHHRYELVQPYPINMQVQASTGPVLGRCYQYRPITCPVLAHNGMCMGYRGSRRQSVSLLEGCMSIRYPQCLPMMSDVIMGPTEEVVHRRFLYKINLSEILLYITNITLLYNGKVNSISKTTSRAENEPL